MVVRKHLNLLAGAGASAAFSEGTQFWGPEFEDRIVVSKDQPESDAKTMMALFQRCLAVLSGSILTEIDPQKWLKRNTLHMQSGTQIMLRMEVTNKLIPTEFAVNTLLS